MPKPLAHVFKTCCKCPKHKSPSLDPIVHMAGGGGSEYCECLLSLERLGREGEVLQAGILLLLSLYHLLHFTRVTCYLQLPCIRFPYIMFVRYHMLSSTSTYKYTYIHTYIHTYIDTCITPYIHIYTCVQVDTSSYLACPNKCVHVQGHAVLCFTVLLYSIICYGMRPS